jgi:hypothetical protein
VVALQLALVVVPLAVKEHQIQLVNQPLLLSSLSLPDTPCCGRLWRLAFGELARKQSRSRTLPGWVPAPLLAGAIICALNLAFYGRQIWIARLR